MIGTTGAVGTGYSTYNTLQTTTQKTGGQTIQQQPQQVQQGPAEDQKEGMVSQSVENVTQTETTPQGGFSTYA